jgi:putative transposase
VKYAFVREQSATYRVSRLIAVLGVSSSGYYAWLDRPLSTRAQRNKSLLAKITVFHRASRETYGSPRIHQDLQENGDSASINRVAQLMQRSGIQSKMRKRFVVTTNSRQTTHPAPDLLQRNFSANKPDQTWVSDTTFIRTRQGWLYLATMIDLYSRAVIGWAMSKSNDAQLVQDALTMAIWRRGRVRHVIVHSDQGSTYASGSYQLLLKEHGLLCSMSRKGECLDNAVAESFFGTLKTEWVDDQDYLTHEQAKQDLFQYIEVFYNRKRRHSHLGYLSPAEYERKHASH